uniref:bacteriophage T4 gp5 trimerisation domain-containing protein n=1 Tax=Helicobacter didelphidarum TaxID=2040648 RepID=UPI0038B2EE26
MIISYLENDIDKPYISSSLYNVSNPPLINPKGDEHKTSLSARTINNPISSLQSHNTQENNTSSLNNSGDSHTTQISLQESQDSWQSINNTTSTKEEINNKTDSNTPTSSLTSSHNYTIESGINELTLSNIKDKEQIYLHAQRDYDEIIEHN